MIKKYIVLILLSSLASADIAVAAVDDFTANGNITVSSVTFGSTAVDLLIMDGSEAETWSYASGVFSVTNPGAYFRVGCSSSTVTAIKASANGSDVACALNSSPGASYLALPAAAAAYTVTPLTIADCDLLCPALSNAASYNSFPTCGAASCDSGYVLSGSGGSATCVAQAVSSGGGGGGSPSVNPVTSTVNPDVQETYVAAPDGTIVSSEIVIERNEAGSVVSEAIETVITVAEDTALPQAMSIDTSGSSIIKSLSLNLPAAELNRLAGISADRKISVSIESREADSVQKTHGARDGKFMVGFDVFDVNIGTDLGRIREFETPLTLTFDISTVEYKDKDLKIYFFNESNRKWELAGNGGVRDNDRLSVNINHMTIFAIMFWITSVAKAEELDDRSIQMQRIYSEANVVYNSGNDLNSILAHNSARADTAGQKRAMEGYTGKIIGADHGLTINQIYAVNNFIVYGTRSTIVLGAGERAGVVNSYRKAFKKLPKSEEEWKDCIAIGNGRWPGELNNEAENTAKAEFKKVYRRDPDMAKPNDNAAVTVIAYGLRPANRNMNSEAAAIRIFRAIYAYEPVAAIDWDIVRAIAYSGAVR